MTDAEFESVLDRRLSEIRAVLGKKAKEYATGGDRLANFKVAARVLSCAPKSALLGMMAKHLVSVLDIFNGDLANTQEIVDEKFGDMINYLILAEALLSEERSQMVGPIFRCTMAAAKVD